MQQAFYSTLRNDAMDINKDAMDINPAASTGATPPRRANVLRRVVQKWDLLGVLALMGSSAAYGAFALAHVGL